jgi:hypothetical protein
MMGKMEIKWGKKKRDIIMFLFVDNEIIHKIH